jgi:hypothetical protein
MTELFTGKPPSENLMETPILKGFMSVNKSLIKVNMFSSPAYMGLSKTVGQAHHKHANARHGYAKQTSRFAATIQNIEFESVTTRVRASSLALCHERRPDFARRLRASTQSVPGSLYVRKNRAGE